MARYSKRCTATAILLPLSVLVPTAGVCNAEEVAEHKYPIHIDSQPLSSALALFCRQTGLLPWYISPPPAAERIIIEDVNGDYTREEGLQKLAGHTGVEFAIKGNLYLVPRIPAYWQPAAAPLARVELVEANVPIPEVLVQGSHSSNVAILAGQTGPSALKVYNSDELERSGFRTVAAFLRGMLTSNVLTSLPTGASEISAVGQPIDLFGLSASDTTVTIDGHLLAGLAMGGYSQQLDLDSIDLATVERIEVMQGTATALGGGGGIAGRVNVVTRSAFAGTLVNVRSAQLPHIGSSSRDVSLATGIGSREELGTLSFKGSWSVQDPIQADQNNTISAGSARVAQNNPGRLVSAFPPLSADRNTRLLTGEPVGEYSYRLADTAQEMGGAHATFRPGHDVKTFELAVGRDFLSGLSFDVSAGGADSSRSGMVSVIEEKIPRTQIVPPHSTTNPSSVPVLQTTADGRGDGEMTAEQATRFAHVALKSSLFGVGMIRLGHSWSSVSATLEKPTLTDDLTLYRAKTRPYESSARETTLLGMMPLFGREQGTGYLTVSAGYRVEHLADASAIGTAAEADSVGAPVSQGSQIVSSLQGQLALPLLWTDDGRTDPLLQAELSIRADRYRIATDQMASLGREPVTFNKKTGQFSLGFKPFTWGELRAGVSTGFRPAPLTLLSPPAEQQFASLPVPDPLRAGELLGSVKLTYGGSFDLRPETARTYKAGFVLTPPLNDDLRFSADYLWIKKRDVILGPQDLLFADPVAYLSQFPWRVTRETTQDGSPGRIIAIDTTSLNIARLDVRALDLGLNWRTRAGSLGTFELVTNATVAPSFVRKLTPDSASVDEAGMGTLSAPRYRLSAMGVLTGGPLEIGLTGRLTSKIRVDESAIADQGGRSIGRQGYLDLFVGYSMNVPSLGNAKLRVRFDANNVLRRKPEFNAAAPRYMDRFGEDELSSLALSFSIQSAS